MDKTIKKSLFEVAIMPRKGTTEFWNITWKHFFGDSTLEEQSKIQEFFILYINKACMEKDLGVLNIENKTFIVYGFFDENKEFNLTKIEAN